jgi:hypothetical protein
MQIIVTITIKLILEELQSERKICNKLTSGVHFTRSTACNNSIWRPSPLLTQIKYGGQIFWLLHATSQYGGRCVS